MTAYDEQVIYRIIDKIYQERLSQIKKHGFDPEHDKEFNHKGEILKAVEVLICESPFLRDLPKTWRHSAVAVKMISKSLKERIIIAAALLAAEYQRLEDLK